MASTRTATALKQQTRRKATPTVGRSADVVLSKSSYAKLPASVLRAGTIVVNRREEAIRRVTNGTQEKKAKPRWGVEHYVDAVHAATPLQMVELERAGIPGGLIKDLSKRMNMPTTRLVSILGLPKATAERKATANEIVKGSSGQATLGILKLLGIIDDILANSTADGAKGFDGAKWLGLWIEEPHPALGGHKPADLLDTPTGLSIVARVLGAQESGAYQ